MGYYIIKSSIQEGTRPTKDNVRIYREVAGYPKPGVMYKIPAPPERPSVTPQKQPKFQWVFGRRYDSSAVRVWDRRAFTSSVRPGSQFIPVPASLRCEDVRVFYFHEDMFEGWENPALLFDGWIGKGCYAAPKAVLDDIEDAAHKAFKLACLDMSGRGWNVMFTNADCIDVRVVFEPDETFSL